MSDDLFDEVEAINSIYGPETLVSADDQDATSTKDFILRMPSFSEDHNDNLDRDSGDEPSSFRLRFPEEYPAVPPQVLGLHSAGGHSRKGHEAAHELAILRLAVGEVFQPGLVCLFDALEETRRLFNEASSRENNGALATGNESSISEDQDVSLDAYPASYSPVEPADLEEPPNWILSTPVTEQKSTFIARAAIINSPMQATSFVQHLLATDKRARIATHNITAYRVRGAGAATYQDCDDDGETAAGGRLLHLLQLMDVWDVLVVVTRWYGGQKLGPRRFAIINSVAREAVVNAGLLPGGEGGAGGSKKKGAVSHGQGHGHGHGHGK